MKTARQREDARTAWENIAAGYDQFVTPTHIWLANEALRRVDLRPGMRFLDVAAGSGALSIPAVRLGAEVLSVDISPIMLERLKSRAHKEGLSNLQTRAMDGQALQLEDDTFDISGSQFGVMLFPDLLRGLREMVRVTKPGGRVLMNVFGDARKNEFLTFFIKAVQAAVPGFTGPSMDDPPLPFQVSDPEMLRRRMAEARLRDIRVETITEELQFQSGEQMWEWLMNSNPIPGMLIADVTEEQRAAARHVLDGMLRERAGDGDVARLTLPVNIGIGTK